MNIFVDKTYLLCMVDICQWIYSNCIRKNTCHCLEISIFRYFTDTLQTKFMQQFLTKQKLYITIKANTVRFCMPIDILKKNNWNTI